MSPSLRLARWIAFLLPLSLILGALASQYLGGLYPCELCHWQRWPHYAAIVLAGLAFVIPGRSQRTGLVTLAMLAILISGLIGVYHAGVEYHWWPNLAPCASTMTGAGTIEDILAMPVISCDQPQWTFAGISLAGFNALLSLSGALTILALLVMRKPL
ncbi:disulfide bond formation protein B [Sphingomonas sp. FW199]|uniref:disulfide bond formation protein B n=1 Tax=Sphingomonas sp. FW199 TaxID=3400217 RepID=UPI003CF6C162